MVMRLRYFLCSLFFHSALIAVFFAGFKASSPGTQVLHITHAYLFDASKGVVQEKLNHFQKKTKIIKTKKIPHIVRKHSIAQMHKSRLVKASQPASHASEIVKAGVRSLLLEKLHDAIANNLIYPNQAVFLNLSGIARVSFILFPSGVIQSIKVIKSSGSAILDQAAVATLHKIVPFVPAEKYLKSSQYFTISIGFKVS